MKRRCKFLDELPAYNYNVGRGDIMNKLPLLGNTHYNVAHLGSILIRAMLREVEDFCDPLVAKKWTGTEYQQVIQYFNFYLANTFNSCF